MARRARPVLLSLVTFFFCPVCLNENGADEATLPALWALHSESGHCLVQTNHATVANTRLAFCGQIPRARCNRASVLFDGPALSELNEGVLRLGTDITLCAIDASAFSAYIQSLSAPNHPVLAKYGAQKSPMSDPSTALRMVESCSAVGMTGPPYVQAAFQELLAEAELGSIRRTRVLLERYATQSSCRNSLSLTTAERAMNQNIANGTRPDFSLCDFGAGDDPNYTNCPGTMPR